MINKIFAKIGLKPVADLVAGENGILSVLKENSDPSSKISSKKSAASAMIFTAIAMASVGGEPTKTELYLIGLFAVCGTALLAITVFKK